MSVSSPSRMVTGAPPSGLKVQLAALEGCERAAEVAWVEDHAQRADRVLGVDAPAQLGLALGAERLLAVQRRLQASRACRDGLGGGQLQDEVGREDRLGLEGAGGRIELDPGQERLIGDDEFGELAREGFARDLAVEATQRLPVGRRQLVVGIVGADQLGDGRGKRAVEVGPGVVEDRVGEARAGTPKGSAWRAPGAAGQGRPPALPPGAGSAVSCARAPSSPRERDEGQSGSTGERASCRVIPSALVSI
ncbi:MAG: hypothetical protein QM765_23225 [Myxococcales bacterium]